MPLVKYFLSLPQLISLDMIVIFHIIKALKVLTI